MWKQAAIQAITVLVIAAIVALWNYYQWIALVTLLVTVGWLGLEGYQRYVSIRERRGIGRRGLYSGIRDEEWAGDTEHPDEGTPPQGRMVAPTKGRELVGSATGDRPDTINSNRPTNFSGLLKSGKLSRGDKVLLGIDERGQPVYGDGTTTGLAGKTGGGKTVTTAFLMAQRVVQTQGDVRFIVVDPHMYVNSTVTLFHVSEPLSPFFLTLDEIRKTVDSSDHEYLAYLDWMEHNQITNPNSGGELLKAWAGLVELEFQRRLRGKTGPLWVWIIDEFNGEMEDEGIASVVSPVLGRIGRQARKMDMNAILIAQVWTADTIGGKTNTRKSISQMYVHRLNESDASLILPAQDAKAAPRLEVGQALVYTTQGDVHKLRIPLTTELDLAGLANEFNPAYEFWIEEEEQEPFSSGRTEQIGNEKQGPLLLAEVKRVDSVPVQPERRLAPSVGSSPARLNPALLEFNPADVQQVRDLLKQGLTEQNIAKLVFGAKSGGELELAVKRVRAMVLAMLGE